MVNPLNAMQYIQAQGDLGRERGMQNHLARLSSQGYSAAPEQQQAILSQAALTSPAAAAQMQQQFNASEDRTLSQLRGYVDYVNRARQTGNPEAVNAALRAGGPMIQRLTGKAPPTEWTPDMDAGWAELEAKVAMGAAGGGSARVQSRFVADDGTVWALMADGQRQQLTDAQGNPIKADRQMWLRDHPGMEPHLVGKDASITPVGSRPGVPMGAAPGSAQAPVPQGGGQGFVDDSLALANQMIAAGIPAEQVDAFLQQRMNPAPQSAPQSPALSPPLNYTGGGLARPSEAQTAAEVEAAKQAAQLAALPQRQAIETQGAIDRKTAEQRVERMPVAVMNTVVELEEKAATASGILDRMKEHRQKINEGKLNFGPIENMKSRAANFTGNSTEQSRNFQLFMSDLEKMRNDSLRLNNGVQTEGDAQRAWNELFANLNDREYVLAGLDRIDRINQRAAELYRNQAANIRAEYPASGTGMYAPAPSDGPGNRFQNTAPVVDGPAVRVQSAADYDALPSGALYIAPDGSQRRKR